jgi:hypothetical protein
MFDANVLKSRTAQAFYNLFSPHLGIHSNVTHQDGEEPIQY